MNVMSPSILSIQTNGWLHQNVDQTKLSSPVEMIHSIRQDNQRDWLQRPTFVWTFFNFFKPSFE